ncbi:MAG: ABC transporter ATP-binding protein, partial [Deltaproteobacteria bacterium]|nr:ABC transporter ATP-binding protein [Deltaproteobacteria bacterium]
NRLATVVWEVKDGGVLPSPGNLDDWLYHQRQLADAAGEDAAGPGAGDAGPRPGDRDRRRAEAEARNVRYRVEKPLRDRIQAVESRVAEMEQAEREATDALADPAIYDDFARARIHVEARQRAQSELARLYGECERLSGELEGLA